MIAILAGHAGIRTPPPKTSCMRNPDNNTKKAIIKLSRYPQGNCQSFDRIFLLGFFWLINYAFEGTNVVNKPIISVLQYLFLLTF